MLSVHWIACGWKGIDDVWRCGDGNAYEWPGARVDDDDGPDDAKRRLGARVNRRCRRATFYTAYSDCIHQACISINGDGRAITNREQVFFAFVVIYGSIIERAAPARRGRRARPGARADAARAAALEAAAEGEREAAARRAAEAEAERARRAAADDIRRDRAARREARRRAEAAERTQDEEAARRWKKGVDAVEEALRELRAACAEDSDYGGAVKALMNILGAIVEKPDDDARRKLRCANEAFARDVDRHAGGRACLFASGFILTHRSTAAPAPDGDEDDDWVTWESFLILREPDPLSDGFDAWTAWFDNVKACHERLCDEFQAIAEVAKAHAGGLLQGEMPAWASTRRSLY